MTDVSRRKLLSLMGAGAVAVPAAAVIGTLPSRAQAQDEFVDEASAQAVALQYKAETEEEGKNCLSCTLYQGDETGGACPLFAGAKVHANGWCSAYTPKA